MTEFYETRIYPSDWYPTLERKVMTAKRNYLIAASAILFALCFTFAGVTALADAFGIKFLAFILGSLALISGLCFVFVAVGAVIEHWEIVQKRIEMDEAKERREKEEYEQVKRELARLKAKQ